MRPSEIRDCMARIDTVEMNVPPPHFDRPFASLALPNIDDKYTRAPIVVTAPSADADTGIVEMAWLSRSSEVSEIF